MRLAGALLSTCQAPRNIRVNSSLSATPRSCQGALVRCSHARTMVQLLPFKVLANVVGWREIPCCSAPRAHGQREFRVDLETL
eukprot:382826-Pyramimonas_sp.AAC.1